MCLSHKSLGTTLGTSIIRPNPVNRSERFTTAHIDAPRIGIQSHSIGPSIINPVVQPHPIATGQVAPRTQRKIWDIFSRFRN